MADNKMAFLTQDGLHLFWRNIRKILVPVFVCDTSGSQRIKEVNVDPDLIIKNGTQMIVNFLNTNTASSPQIALVYPSSTPGFEDEGYSPPEQYAPISPSGEEDAEEAEAEESASSGNVSIYQIDEFKAGYLSGLCHFIYYNNMWHLVSSEAATQRTIFYTEGDTPYNYKVGDIWLKKKEIVT